MKNSSRKEEPSEKRYIFFSDPDVIAKRAETSAVAAQIARDPKIQQQSLGKQSIDLQASTFDIKSLENLLSYHPVQPYPFTFISAVKQKLALGDCTDISTKIYDSNLQTKNNLASSLLRVNSTHNLYQIVQKMDLVRPLKVPDLKISSKTVDFSNRENSISKELPSTKSDVAAKELAHDRPDKAPRTGERVQRKLDFSSSDASVINCESIEPLKAPNVSIAFNLNKKKEHVRDNSREKENRSKRMKKDESLCAKREESAQDQIKRSRSPRHVSRKDAIDTSNITKVPLSKNDRLSFHTTKSNDSLSAKSKVKSFVTSTAKKDNDKRQRSLNVQSVELSRDNPLSKSRIPSNELSAFRSWKAVEKVTLRDNSVSSNNSEAKPKDICHSRQRPEVEDLKYKSDLDNRQSKQDKPNVNHKEQTKRITDKSKTSNKVEGKLHSVNSEPSEDIGSMSETSSSKNRANAYPASSGQQAKSNDSETITENKESVNLTRSTKTSENLRYTEHSVMQSASTSTKKDEESYSQSITTKETTANDDSNDVDIEMPEALFDSRRISFRDGYSQQEFPNLITPEKMNLMLRTKRRRYLVQSSDSEVDARCPKYKSMIKQEKQQEEMQLMHPTALHMQFQAELHLYDSFNESLNQVMNVEKHLYDTKREQEQKNPQKEDVEDKELEKTVQVEEAADNNDAVEKS